MNLAQITPFQWANYDNRQLSQLTGRKENAIAYYRRSKNLPKGPRVPGSGRPATKDLSAFDPSVSDAQNARACGISVTYARVLRLKQTKEFC